MLFDTADSTRNGVLEWNTGEVMNFGKAVLDTYGRNSDGSQTLLYNAYDDVDRNMDAKMSLDEGMEFARKVLEYSAGKGQASPSSKGPDMSSAIFDTHKSSASSQRAERTVPYSGPIITADGPVQYATPAFIDQKIGSELDTLDAALAREQGAAEYIKQLEEERDKLTEENSQIRAMYDEIVQQLDGLQNMQAHGAAEISGELARRNTENAELTAMCRGLQEQVSLLEAPTASAFDPMSRDQIEELQRQNQDLLSHIQNMESTQQSEANLSHELRRAHEEKAQLSQLNQELEQQLMQALESQDRGLPSAKGNADLNERERLLADRERMMSEEIDRLQSENARLQKQAIPGGAVSSPEKQNKFLCC